MQAVVEENDIVALGSLTNQYVTSANITGSLAA